MELKASRERKEKEEGERKMVQSRTSNRESDEDLTDTSPWWEEIVWCILYTTDKGEIFVASAHNTPEEADSTLGKMMRDRRETGSLVTRDLPWDDEETWEQAYNIRGPGQVQERWWVAQRDYR